MGKKLRIIKKIKPPRYKPRGQEKSSNLRVVIL